MKGEYLWVAGAGGALSLLFLGLSLRLRRKQRLLRDLPTSKARGVFIGLVEIKGTAESEAPLHSFLAEQSCVQYHYTVEEHWSRTVTETYTDKDGKTQTRTRQESGWKTVAEGGEASLFYLRDDTGAVLVRPEGAKIEPQTLFDQTVPRGDPLYYAKGPDVVVADSDHRRHFVEKGLPLHAPLYVVGQARERADVVAPEIAASKDAAMFLISTRSEERVQKGFATGSWVLWALGLLIAPGFLLIGLSQTPGLRGSPLLVQIPVAALAAYLLLWGLSWVWMAYNSLVGLRQRVRQGWSLIDVQLKRRHDLIPNLAAAVSGLSQHERETQTAIAALRAQMTATPPGMAGPDYAGVAVTLRAIVEKYPELIAQESFARLQRELVETEQRIALARTYYNDIATQFATRLEQVPDRWAARLGAMRPEALLQAEGFERAPVQVKFAV
jgi:hypothetical protein